MEYGIVVVDFVQQNRDEGRLPVVTMKNVGDPKNFGRFDYRP